MKFSLIVLVSLMLVSPVMAAELKLGRFDQAKLGELLENLPEVQTLRQQEKDTRRGVTIVSLSFPRKAAPFHMKCSRSFYGEAPYPSETLCEVTVDKAHPQAILKHDVVRVTVKDPETVRAFHDTIPYGTPQKKFYSYDRDQGTTFTGEKGTVFHYQVICSERTCWFKFSNKILTE